jgi:hypothetical protein
MGILGAALVLHGIIRRQRGSRRLANLGNCRLCRVRPTIMKMAIDIDDAFIAKWEQLYDSIEHDEEDY